MSASENFGKVFVVDTNLFFVKRLTEALKQQGFETVHCSEAAYALTMIEWNMPVAILCATNARSASTFEIPAILRADLKTSHIPVIAIGDRGQQSQLEALRAGYADLMDRRLGADEIAAHLVSLLASNSAGFQPTQMLTRAETALDGRLSMVDLPGVIQMIEQSRQTGGLHVNSSATDGIIFFNAGEVIHAESGLLAGDDAIVHLIKRCQNNKDGVYKFIPGSAPTLRTVHCNLNGLIMDALRELDEEQRDAALEPDTPLNSDVTEETIEAPGEKLNSPEEEVHDSLPMESSMDSETEKVQALEITKECDEIVEEPEIHAAPQEDRSPVASEARLPSDGVDDSPMISELSVFDSASIDSALSALDGQIFDLEVGKEETHE